MLRQENSNEKNKEGETVSEGVVILDSVTRKDLRRG